MIAAAIDRRATYRTDLPRRQTPRGSRTLANVSIANQAPFVASLGARPSCELPERSDCPHHSDERFGSLVPPDTFIAAGPESSSSMLSGNRRSGRTSVAMALTTDCAIWMSSCVACARFAVALRACCIWLTVRASNAFDGLHMGPRAH